MKTAVKIVMEVTLDDETLEDIELLRQLRLDHYEQMAIDPDIALRNLVNAGLTENSSSAQIAATALEKIQELKKRLLTPDIVYEDELSLYVNSLKQTGEI